MPKEIFQRFNNVFISLDTTNDLGLFDHFHQDKSTLIKRSLFELYENILDLNEIKKFEAKGKRGKVSFSSAEEILND